MVSAVASAISTPAIKATNGLAEPSEAIEIAITNILTPIRTTFRISVSSLLEALSCKKIPSYSIV
ncbi:MAG: hypothetical protein HC854_01805 [Flavobacterium sp.]|nr:hypothetical protein [Flavobacterium sp.]